MVAMAVRPSWRNRSILCLSAPCSSVEYIGLAGYVLTPVTKMSSSLLAIGSSMPASFLTEKLRTESLTSCWSSPQRERGGAIPLDDAVMRSTIFKASPCETLHI